MDAQAHHRSMPNNPARGPLPGAKPELARALFPGHSRERARVLRSEGAKRVLRRIREQPGIPCRELCDALETGWGTLYHHLTRLERAGFIVTVRQGRRRLLYPKGEADASKARATGLLSGATCRHVAEAILRHGPLRLYDLQARTGLSYRAVAHHADRLRKAGLVERRERNDPLTASPRLESALHGLRDVKQPGREA